MRATDLLLETATTADHVASADALVYCVGALKFLSGTSTVIKVLARRNCLHSMAVLLAAINKTVRVRLRVLERACARFRALERACARASGRLSELAQALDRMCASRSEAIL